MLVVNLKMVIFFYPVCLKAQIVNGQPKVIPPYVRLRVFAYCICTLSQKAFSVSRCDILKKLQVGVQLCLQTTCPCACLLVRCVCSTHIVTSACYSQFRLAHSKSLIFTARRVLYSYLLRGTASRMGGVQRTIRQRKVRVILTASN